MSLDEMSHLSQSAQIAGTDYQRLSDLVTKYLFPMGLESSLGSLIKASIPAESSCPCLQMTVLLHQREISKLSPASSYKRLIPLGVLEPHDCISSRTFVKHHTGGFIWSGYRHSVQCIRKPNSTKLQVKLGPLRDHKG